MKRSLKHIIILLVATIFVLCSLHNGKTEELDRLLKEAQGIRDPYKRATALADISGKFIRTGKKDEASDILGNALDTSERIKLPSYKAIAYVKIAEMYTETGEKNKTAKILENALQIVDTFKYDRYKDNFRVRIAKAYAAAGFGEEARQIADAISNPVKKKTTLKDIERVRKPPPKITRKKEPEKERVIIPEKPKKPIPPVAEVRPEDTYLYEEEEEKKEILERYRSFWGSVGGKGTTPSFSAGLRVNHFGFEFGMRSDGNSVGGNTGMDFLVFINPYNRFSLYSGLGVYIDDESENEDMSYSVGFQAYVSHTFHIGFGYHHTRGINGSIGIQF